VNTAAYDPTLDVDTNENGTAPPFERWEGDHTALVHVLWHAEHSGWIVRRPSADAPLCRAIYDRLLSGDTNRERASYEHVIDDLREILDAHADVDGRRLDSDQISNEQQRKESDGITMTASALCGSRALAAITAYQRAGALKAAANYFRDRSEETLDRHEVVRLLEYLAQQETGTPVSRQAD
jgi:hypothetical protein